MRDATHAELAPAAAALRYRFPLDTPSGDNDDDSSIAILEERDRTLGSPFDSAELAEVYFSRAQQRGDREDYARAERAAEKSLAILRSPNGALLTLAKVRAARHRFGEAIALAQEQLTHRRSSGAYVLIATAQLALGNLPEAQAAADQAIAVRPDTGGYTTRALVEEARGHDAEAAADFARAAAVEPSGKPAAARMRALWARLLIRRGQYPGARALLDEARRVDPDEPLAIAMRGQLMVREGDAAGGAKELERAFAQSRQVRYLIDEAEALALVPAHRADSDALLAEAELLIRRELADDGYGHALDLIEVLVDRGAPAGLEEAAALGRTEVTRRASLEVRYQLARALAKTGRDAEADAQVQAALATGAHEAQVFALAATLAHRRGDGDAAARYTQAADGVDPVDSGWRAP